MGWLTSLGTQVDISKTVTKGILTSYVRPSGWIGDSMVPPLYRVTVTQTDTTLVYEFRALTKDTAKNATPSYNSITLDSYGNVTQRISCEALRANEAEGWTLRVTQVDSVYTTSEVTL